jgi:ferredoxin
VSICPNNALEFDGEYPLLLKPDQCTECGICEDQCPTGAITLTTKMHRDVSGPEIRGDKTYIEISESLKGLLHLNKPPVGVKLISDEGSVPPEFTIFDSPTRHCVSIHMASLGASLYVSSKNHACAAAKAALAYPNFRKRFDQEKYLTCMVWHLANRPRQGSWPRSPIFH